MRTDLFAPGASATLLEGVIERVVYADPGSGWTVASLQPQAGGAAVTLVGTLPGLRPGESVRLEGAWENDRRYGRQFRVRTFTSLPPTSAAAIEKYLASGLVRGVGPVLARRLVQHFDTSTLEVLEREPERLSEVRGLGKMRAAAIRAAWQEQRHLQEIALFLQAHDLGSHYALRLFRAYGAGAVEVLRQDPYRLAQEVTGIGFRSADHVARALGLPLDAEPRLEAGVLHVLDRATDEGHCFLPRPALVRRTTQLLAEASAAAGETPVPASLVEPAVDALAGRGALVLESAGNEVAVYTPRLHDLERRCARALQALLLQAPPAPAAAADLMAELEAKAGLSLSKSQRQAVLAALISRLLVITGGPGTGKTTLVRVLLDLVERLRLRGVLCAPTGRAAKRLAAASGREASTLHRLLEWNPREARFLRAASRPLDGDVFVVDETSMVDLPLLHHLLQALPPRSRLLCVGDADQLPSVGPGATLADLLASGCVPVVQLRELFRQDEKSLIVHNAHRIRRGEPPDLPPPGQRADFVHIERQTPASILATLRQLVCERLPASLGVEAEKSIQVLTPMNRGALGTVALNAALQEWLNPHGTTVGATALRVGDKVMQVRNNYDLDVFNGDQGRIIAVDEKRRQVLVHFDERAVHYDFEALHELAPAYAMTVHKAQGSEYPVVVLVLHAQHHVMLQRNLLYTAVTRARRQVVLIGQRRALHTALSNARRQDRHTRLGLRLRALLEERPLAPG